MKMATRHWPASPDTIAAAAVLLRQGRLVAFPTETVYGLGADACSGEAVARIYEAKGRPRFNPLIAHVADLDQALGQGRFDRDALALAQAFWPGPLTLIVPVAATCTVSHLARSGLDSVALRVPDHPVAMSLLREAGVPVAAPSANRSGRISPTSADHVMGDLKGRIDVVLDGGVTAVGLESTILACLGDGIRLLRPGGLKRAAIEAVLGRALNVPTDLDPVVAPGMMASHYAPQAAVRLDAVSVGVGEAVLDFGGRFSGVTTGLRLDLSDRGDLTEAAANLFCHLHRLDDAGATRIAVAPVPVDGLGEAINDRLRRAAAPRP
ncbi:L-threonylcarbamoyladenylate synthase [Lichenifustis flavocetrariae]|uniref:Threonylcarbamoyl-AMP synthase n=1 Tax=Lichenifustis flavocetrariae TaxID=2949735 RepID=A0AA41YRE0_9HYPH|nr:L-threonylcarbamoyladenylate synthase [Lichenifustis flavocetrariae]MCW6507169.1 L-threonylcarbamoyladenylate synthase [Lichenifustis flavocetrariae]